MPLPHYRQFHVATGRRATLRLLMMWTQEYCAPPTCASLVASLALSVSRPCDWRCRRLMYLLANQGNGNFFFIDDPDKLLEVFHEEMKYILTPVLENLRVWFRLPPELDVEEIYGFEFGVVDGDYVILAPEQQYSVTPEEEADKPDDDGKVTMSTVFASKKNGLVMVKILAPQLAELATISEDVFATIYYRYTLVESGVEETNSVDVKLDNFVWPGAGEVLDYYTSDIIRRNLCVLRIGLAMKHACTVYHQAPDDYAALEAQVEILERTEEGCKEVFDYLVSMNWEDRFVDETFDDLQVIHKLASNIAAILPEPEPIEEMPDVISEVADGVGEFDVISSDISMSDGLAEEDGVGFGPDISSDSEGVDSSTPDALSSID